MIDSRKKMLERIRGILAKTIGNGCTEGEAMTALSKAQELMAAYDISESELDHPTEETESAVIHKDAAADPYKIKACLTDAIARFTGCKGWSASGEYTIGFAGLESDVAFATWLLNTLAAFVLRELRAHQERRRVNGLRCPRIVSASFVKGCVARIDDRLKKLTPSAPIPATSNAMTVSRNALIAEVMKKAGITLRTVRSYGRINGASYGAGQAAGNAARFDKPVSTDSGVPRLGSR